MKHSCVWTLILLLLWAVPGCSSSEGKETATIVIGEGNSLFQKRAGQSEGVVYGPGDTVLVEWEDGTCWVNGEIYKPQPPQPPTVYPVERLKGKYGTVPSVVEYVSTHPGDETEVWNEAYREWERQRRLLTRKVARQYVADLESGKTADEAAEAGLEALRANPLVGFAQVFDSPDPTEHPVRMIEVRWAGLSYEVLIELSPQRRPGVSPPKPMTHDDFKAFVRIMRRLEGEGPATIEIKGGNLNYISGPGTEERIEKQRRGKQ